MSRILSKSSSEDRRNPNTQLNGTGAGSHEKMDRFQGQIDDIIKELYVGIGGPAAAEIQNLLSIAMHNPEKCWSIEDPIMELLFIWYPALSGSIKVALLRFLSLALASNKSIVSSAMPMKIVKENIKNFNLSGETAHEDQCSLELLAYSINLGVIVAQDVTSFLQGIKETILSFLSPFMLHEGTHELSAKTLQCLKPHLVAYRDTYASEAIPLLIAGIDETVEAWQLKERGELIAMLATSSTAEMIVDCLGGLPTLMAPNHSRDSVTIIHALASRLEQLPESDNLMSVLSGLLCSQIQFLVDSDSSISNLESGILVIYQALVRGSGPLVLSTPVLDQLSSLLIQIGNHGHHVAFLHSKVLEALPFYLSLVGRYARNDPSLAAHLEQLLAAGGLDVVLQSDVLPLLAARFSEGPYNTLLPRFIQSTKESVSRIKLQLFERLFDLRNDLLEVLTVVSPFNH
ncbi:hypothetical protein DSO57_1004890 [Entomophthora muscae]|uniref:Uncharacterized protein n=1 Tax=Entomophthora muscae TaxID=34485 RepID=A0ACC2TW88_9FUNG|nr:hypothetical protein DSO57_1004890 [Entomophthora muscae]